MGDERRYGTTGRGHERRKTAKNQLPPYQRRQPEERSELTIAVPHTEDILRDREQFLHSLLPHKPQEYTNSPLSLTARISQSPAGLGASLSGARSSILYRLESYEGKPRGRVPLIWAKGAQMKKGGDKIANRSVSDADRGDRS